MNGDMALAISVAFLGIICSLTALYIFRRPKPADPYAEIRGCMEKLKGWYDER